MTFKTFITFDEFYHYYQRDARNTFNTSYLDKLATTTRLKEIPLQYEKHFIDATTHPSYQNKLVTLSTGEQYMTKSYQQLEFLGDSIINTCVVSYLVQKYPNKDEGFLSKMKIKLIQTKQLARFCQDIELDKFIKISPNVPLKMPILEDVFEAFIGAVFNTHGFDYCIQYLGQLLDKYINLDQLESVNDNYKDTLMRYFKTLPGFNDPRYYMVSGSCYQSIIAVPRTLVNRLDSKVMSLHHKIASEIKGIDVYSIKQQCCVEVSITQFCQDFIIVGYGYNKKKKIAEQYAAKSTLERFGCPYDF